MNNQNVIDNVYLIGDFQMFPWSTTFFPTVMEDNDGDGIYSATISVLTDQIIEYKFSDTSAIISNLNLIISIDTAVAHLSAAMNKETWITLSYNHDWRWGLKKMKSHWYNSVRLFRADSKNNWEKVFENIIKNIEKK